MFVLAFAPAAMITIIAAVLIVLAIVVFLVAVIVELRKITDGLDVVIPPVAQLVAKTAPVNRLVDQINADLSAGANLLEGLLLKKAGMEDSAALIEGMFPGGGSAFMQRQGRSGKPKRIGVVYTRGALQLARLGRGSPLGAPTTGPALRDPLYASASPRSLYPDPRAGERPKSPVVGTDSPRQYDPSGDVPMPATPVGEPPAPARPRPPAGGGGGGIQYRRPAPAPAPDAPAPAPAPDAPAPDAPAPAGAGTIQYRRSAPTATPAPDAPAAPPDAPAPPPPGDETISGGETIRYRRS